jgi:DNA-binding response OmpR family regulator
MSEGGPVVRRQSGSVLCIGNDPVHLNLRCSLLQEHGWIVLSAGSGHDGVQRFDREKVHAVVIDLGGDGSEAALITGVMKGKRPEIPVILISDEGELAAGATTQADSVIAKLEESRRLPEQLQRLIPRRKGGPSKSV